MEAPKTGIFPGMSFEDYSRIRAVNHSILRHFSKTPAHARWRMLHEDEPSPHQALGHAVHMALLEPERFKTDCVVAPACDRRTKIGKADWSDFEERAKGKLVVTAEDMERIAGIQTSVAAHETARMALYGEGISELSLVWQDPETGLYCKGRLDRLASISGYPTIVDLKTTHRPASTYAWQTGVQHWALHEQAAHYCRGLATLRPLPDGYARKFFWAVAETEPPFACRLFEIDEVSLSIGADNVAKHLRAYKECSESGIWPAWDQGVETCGLPGWALKVYDVE